MITARRTLSVALVLLAVGSAVAFWPDHHHRRPAPAAAASNSASLDVPAEAATTLAPLPPTTEAPSTAAPTTAKPAPKPVIATRARCAPAPSPTLQAAGFPGDDPQGGKHWVTVGGLDGICNGQSSPFHINGIDTRLLYRSDADSFAVFLVDAKLGLDATSGYSDGDCSGRCSVNQVLVDKAGDYYLMVQAGDGPWQVLVQEYR